MILEVEKGGLNILAKTPSLLHKIANEIIWNNKLLCINKKSVYFISTEENLNPEQESFPWLEHHVVNKEGKMFCFVCRRYDRSSSFCVGSTNFKLETG
ncbi:unnamed protein product, partial [Pocillopora meandrina]